MEPTDVSFRSGLRKLRLPLVGNAQPRALHGPSKAQMFRFPVVARVPRAPRTGYNVRPNFLSGHGMAPLPNYQGEPR